jgi:hypothetical protein
MLPSESTPTRLSAWVIATLFVAAAAVLVATDVAFQVAAPSRPAAYQAVAGEMPAPAPRGAQRGIP